MAIFFRRKIYLSTGRILKGFKWRGDERILTKDAIFDEDDNNLVLPVIRGISNPIDIDAEEEERRTNENDPVNNIQPTNDRAIDPKDTSPKKKTG